MAVDPYAVLRQVFVKVLDEQMFLFAEDTELDEQPTIDEQMLRVIIIYNGDADGKIELFLSLNLCRELCASVLGMEENELGGSVDIRDVARELLNMTCGQFLTAYYGFEPVMNLQPPQAIELTPEEFDKFRKSFIGLTFLIDEQLVMLSFVAGKE